MKASTGKYIAVVACGVGIALIGHLVQRQSRGSVEPPAAETTLNPSPRATAERRAHWRASNVLVLQSADDPIAAQRSSAMASALTERGILPKTNDGSASEAPRAIACFEVVGDRTSASVALDRYRIRGLAIVVAIGELATETCVEQLDASVPLILVGASATAEDPYPVRRARGSLWAATPDSANVLLLDSIRQLVAMRRHGSGRLDIGFVHSATKASVAEFARLAAAARDASVAGYPKLVLHSIAITDSGNSGRAIATANDRAPLDALWLSDDPVGRDVVVEDAALASSIPVIGAASARAASGGAVIAFWRALDREAEGVAKLVDAWLEHSPKRSGAPATRTPLDTLDFGVNVASAKRLGFVLPPSWVRHAGEHVYPTP